MRHQTCESSRQRWAYRAHLGARRTVDRFAQDRGGAVLIEMSIVLLILVTMLIGVTELSQALTLQRRVVSAASSAADLMTRATPANTPLGRTNLDNMRGVLDEIVGPTEVEDDSTRLFGFKVTVFSVKSDAEGDKESEPSSSYKCDFDGTGTQTVPAGLLEEVDVGGRIILVETQLRYTSAFTVFISETITLEGSSFFVPRLGSVLALDGHQDCGVPLDSDSNPNSA